MANIKPRANEIVLMAGMGNNMLPDRAVGEIGYVFLTNQRIVFHRKNKVLQTLFPLYFFLSKGVFAFDIYLDQINGVSLTKKNFQKMLLLQVLRGRSYVFGVSKPKNWIDEIVKAMTDNYGVQLIQDREGGWKRQ